jgi:serine/threonine protein kinase
MDVKEGQAKLLPLVKVAVQKLHKTGWSHNDLHESNILISKDHSKCWLIDFGESSLLKDVPKKECPKFLVEEALTFSKEPNELVDICAILYAFSDKSWPPPSLILSFKAKAAASSTNLYSIREMANDLLDAILYERSWQAYGM